MKRTFILLSLIVLLFGQTVIGAVSSTSNQPDSIYLFSFATAKNSNTNGLHFAWSPISKTGLQLDRRCVFFFATTDGEVSKNA